MSEKKFEISLEKQLELFRTGLSIIISQLI